MEGNLNKCSADKFKKINKKKIREGIKAKEKRKRQKYRERMRGEREKRDIK